MKKWRLFDPPQSYEPKPMLPVPPPRPPGDPLIEARPFYAHIKRVPSPPGLRVIIGISLLFSALNLIAIRNWFATDIWSYQPRHVIIVGRIAACVIAPLLLLVAYGLDSKHRVLGLWLTNVTMPLLLCITFLGSHFATHLDPLHLFTKSLFPSITLLAVNTRYRHLFQAPAKGTSEEDQRTTGAA